MLLVCLFTITLLLTDRVLIDVLIVLIVCPAESQSETEQVAPEAQDLSGATSPSDSGSAPITDQRPAPSEQLEAEPTSPSPAHKPSQG